MIWVVRGSVFLLMLEAVSWVASPPLHAAVGRLPRAEGEGKRWDDSGIDRIGREVVGSLDGRGTWLALVVEDGSRWFG